MHGIVKKIFASFNFWPHTNRNRRHTEPHFIRSEIVWFTFAIFFHHCWLLFAFCCCFCFLLFLLLQFANFPAISIATFLFISLRVFSISVPFISLFAAHREHRKYSRFACLLACLFVCSPSFTLRLLCLHINIALIQNTANHRACVFVYSTV